MKIESTDQEIRNLLSSGYFRIPRFQRPYSWTRENIQEFWDDVVRDNLSDYFIGAMVVFGEGDQRYGVVDGQQRLTTITIFLAALRDTLAEEKLTDLAEGIQGVLERKNIENKPEFILSTETSYPFLQDRILKFGEPEAPFEERKEEARLRSAYEQLKELLDQKISSVKTDPSLTERKREKEIRSSLIGIRDALLSLKIILVKLDTEDDAYIIFETLNTRGKDLSLTDLVKNHLSKHLRAKHASIDQTAIKWKSILETIEGSNLDLKTDTYIHHFWLSRYDYRSAKTLFKELRKRITKAKSPCFLNDLMTDAKTYREIHDVAYGQWTKQQTRITTALLALQLFRVQQQTPCVLALVRAFREGKIKKAHLEQALVAIENFHFLFTAITSQRSSGGISGMYARLGRAICDASDTHEAVKVIQELKGMLRARVPSTEEFDALFPEVIYTNTVTRQRGLVRYILTTIHRENNLLQNPDYNSMTIEHLVPQSSIGNDGLTEEVVGQIGNLVLISGPANSKLGNKSFTQKKGILKKAGILLPSDVASATQWGAAEIKKRTAAIAAEAYTKHWKI